MNKYLNYIVVTFSVLLLLHVTIYFIQTTGAMSDFEQSWDSEFGHCVTRMLIFNAFIGAGGLMLCIRRYIGVFIQLVLTVAAFAGCMIYGIGLGAISTSASLALILLVARVCQLKGFRVASFFGN